MTNDIWQHLGLDIVHINTYIKFYQHIPYGSRVIGNFRKLIADIIFTNASRTDTQGDNRAYSESKLRFSARRAIIIITLFQEDNIFGMYASLTYGPQLQR